MDDCMKLKITNENMKVRRALCPQQTCPNKPRLCPPQHPMRSSIYHPNFRTENHCCTQDWRYIPTEAAMKEIEYKPPNRNLYNQLKREGARIKIISDGGCYEHRNVNKLHCNLQEQSSCMDKNGRQLYICNDCGCGYQDKNDCGICASKAKGNRCNAVYFEVGPQEVPCNIENQNCVQEQIVEQDQCNEGRENKNTCSVSSCGSGNHFQDCQCVLCKKRCDMPAYNHDMACQDQDPKSSSRKCGQQKSEANCSGARQNDCDSVENFGQSCCTQPNALVSLPDLANPEQSNQVPCHHVFRLGDEIKQQPTGHCVIDMSNNTAANGNYAGVGLPSSSCTQQGAAPAMSTYWPDAFGNDIPVNQCAPKQRAEPSSCCYFANSQDCAQALHATNCSCGLCTRTRCESSRRPHYYAHLQRKSQCREKMTTYAIPSAPLCYPIKCGDAEFSVSGPCTAPQLECGGDSGCGVSIELNPLYSCKSNCICHVMIPKEWEPQDRGTCKTSCARPTRGRQIKLPSCTQRRKEGCRCSRRPCLVRSLGKVNGKKNAAAFGRLKLLTIQSEARRIQMLDN